MFNDEIKDYGRLYDDIVKFTKDYIVKCGLRSAVIGISGGIDSTVVAAILHEVAKEINYENPDYSFNVYGYSMPTKTTNSKEYLISTFVGNAFCNNFETVNIGDITDEMCNFCSTKGSLQYNITSLRTGNIKARFRMIYLYDKAKEHNGFVVGTDNFTEKLLGFSTIGGDALADYMPIQYLWKTQVYALAHYMLNKYTEDLNYAAMNALFESINIPPQDGLGISTSDMDQIGAKSYFDVDKILQHYERYNLYLEMGGIDTEERFKSYFEALIAELGEDVVNKVVNRRKNNFKLKLPLEFIPEHIECL